MLTRPDLVPSYQLRLDAAGPAGLDLSEWPVTHGPVLSLAVFRETAKGEQILVGIRDPRTNRFHPNVVSVPTQRLPRQLADLLYSPVRSEAVPHNVIDAGTLSYLVHHLFAYKLGADDATLSPHDLEAQLRRVDFGDSVIGAVDGEPKTEQLGMFGVEVRVPVAFVLPPRTPSYSHLFWLPLETFVELGTTQDITLLDIGLLAAEVCVQGLCVHSAVEIVLATRPDVRDRLPENVAKLTVA